MAAHAIDARILVQLRLALSPVEDDLLAAALEREARAVGLTGAEIDAARGGRCFDVRADTAVGFAMAVRAGDSARILAGRDHAQRAGFGPGAIDAIEAMSRPAALAGDPKSERHA